MNADAPPIAADEIMVFGIGERFDHVAIRHDAIHQAFIGGNRRGIGVHRRFQGLSPA
jgi:hypothetical protein